ncbi:MAG: hypothetical protein ACRDVM_07490 [Acidimicrobiia bacterium]
MTVACTAYTLGLEKLTMGELLDTLDRLRVLAVVDVRPPALAAVPPTPGRLAEELAAAGLGFRSLGWRLVDAGPELPAVLGEVMAMAADAPCALVCIEAEPGRCHRSKVLAPALEAAGARVVHVLPDGRLRRHQPALGL